jgi:hypothetical protein
MKAVSSFTYGISAVFALAGTMIAVFGIIREEGKPISTGLVLILCASVFGILYIGTRRKEIWGSCKRGRNASERQL